MLLVESCTVKYHPDKYLKLISHYGRLSGVDFCRSYWHNGKINDCLYIRNSSSATHMGHVGQLVDFNFFVSTKTIFNNNTSQYCNNMKLIAIAQLGVFMVVYTKRDFFLKGSFLVSIKHQLKKFFHAFQPKTEIDSLTRWYVIYRK